MKIGLNPAFLFAHYGDQVFCDQVIAGATRAKELGFPSLGLEKAVSRGLRLAIEPLAMSILSTSDTYLRLADEIRSKDFGILIDTSHLFYQRESLPVAIEKVKGQLFGFCACDNDGVRDFHWAPGKGNIDWREVLRTLKKTGYEGYVDLEINVADDPDSTYLKAREYLENILREI